MKKLLNLLATAMLVSGSSFTAVACANSSSNNIKNIIDITNFTKFNLNQDGLVNITTATTQQEINQKVIALLANSLSTKLNLTAKDFSKIQFFDTSKKPIAVSGTTLSTLKKCYVQYTASADSNFIKGQTPLLSLAINNASDNDILNAVVNNISQTIESTQDNKLLFKNPNGMSDAEAISDLKSMVPSTIDIAPTKFLTYNPSNYDSSKVNFTITSPQEDPIPVNASAISVKVTYRSASIVETWTPGISDVVKADQQEVKAVNTAIKNPLVLTNSQAANINNQTEVLNYIESNLPLTGESQNYTLKIISFNNASAANITRAIAKFQVLDQNNNSINGDQGFIWEISTPDLQSYYKLKTMLNSQSSFTESLQSLPLIDFVPSLFFDGLTTKEPTNSANLKTLLSNLTLKDFVDSFLNPTGLFAKNMPYVIPNLDSSGNIPQTGSEGDTQYWTYMHSIMNYLQSKGITNVNAGGLAFSKYNTVLNGNSAQIGIDLYNVFKCITPDLVHFHNYIIMKTSQQSKSNTSVNATVNYLLWFMEYLQDGPKNYLANNQKGTSDNFKSINPNPEGEITNNFDNLICDLLQPFYQGTTKFASGGINIVFTSYFAGPLTYIILTQGYVHDNSYDPFTEIVTNGIDKLFTNKGQDGYDITKDFSFSLHFHFGIVGDQDPTFSFALTSLHISELEKLIIKQIPNFPIDNSQITINSGVLFLQGFSPTTNNWINLANVDKDTLSQVTDLRFYFSNVNFNITTNFNNVQFSLANQVIKQFYLTL